MANLLYEKFKINQNVQLNNEDIKSLSLLYLPLMGIDSFAIYSIFSSLDKETEYSFKNIIDLSTIKTLKSLNNGLDKLEGLGLLKTYFNEEKGYIFELIPPLTEKEFIHEEVLMSLLESEIGSIEIEKIKSRYKPVSKQFKNISKSFQDVYHINTTKTQNYISNLVTPSITIKNDEFNYSLFKLLFDSSFIDESLLEDSEFKRWVNRISFVYRLNEEEMKDVVFKTIITDKRSDYPSLSRNARIAFQNKYKVDTPKIETIKEDDFLISEQDDVVIKLANDLESKSPSEILESISGMKPNPGELKIAEDLKNNTNLSYGAINFMIMMVSAEKEGVLPGYNYFEKIAATWSRAKVKNAYDAIKYTEKKNQEKKESSKIKTNNKKQAPVPEWYADYEKNLQEKKEDSNVNLEDLKEAAKKLFED